MITTFLKWLFFILLTLPVGFVFIYTMETAFSQTPVRCVDEADKARVHALTNEALDQAFKRHVERLYEVWIKEPNPNVEPARAKAGIQIGINAWQRARADALKWSPPDCK